MKINKKYLFTILFTISFFTPLFVGWLNYSNEVFKSINFDNNRHNELIAYLKQARIDLEKGFSKESFFSEQLQHNSSEIYLFKQLIDEGELMFISDRGASDYVVFMRLNNHITNKIELYSIVLQMDWKAEKGNMDWKVEKEKILKVEKIDFS